MTKFNIDKALKKDNLNSDSKVENPEISEARLTQLSEQNFKQAKLDRFQGDTTLKKGLTWFVVSFTSLWSIAILVFLFLFGFNKIAVSDVVIITLLTETLITVLGLPLVVTSHFFPQKKEQKKND